MKHVGFAPTKVEMKIKTHETHKTFENAYIIRFPSNYFWEKWIRKLMKHLKIILLR